MSINRNLRKMRRDLRLNVRQVAEATKIPKSTISDIENEMHDSSYSRIKALEDYYTGEIEKRKLLQKGDKE